ncbi:PREDICTED: uncharacterized protein LOC109589081 [Amphimedon queenslandica]|uniref:HD domain-containing protein n=2 Tax=Amphimedon queenslandica TaxID=400682 RepID=A0AAN0JUM8_AMPQE|nr:PREDICTED: uncharacterized protein LOC109589081 [Amphimedon queenslandica]|eukprot:XP_019860764.1 PREDICTED: uncharacterized protein LOC109589081 [Amphimedon queenslandica]
MRLQFGDTFVKVESILKTVSQPTIDEIKKSLRFSYNTLRPQLDLCKDITGILELMSDNSSLDDISMLEYLVNKLNIEEAKLVVQEYKEVIEEFSKTELSKCLHEWFSYASPLQCERITIVVDQETEDYTLKDVRRLSANIFDELSPNVRLNVVRDENSFTITCSFPLILSEQLITAALNNIDVLKENKVKRLTIGYCTVYEIKDTSTATTTEIDEYTSSLSTSSGLMKQLMLSLSVQLINSKEEVTTLNKENMTVKRGAQLSKKEAESLKETLDATNKIVRVSIAESDKFKRMAAESSQLLQEKVLHLTEREEENENLKEIKELLEEQLALFQSEKAELVEKIEETQIQTVLHQEENEAKSNEEIEMLQMKITTIHSQRMEMDKKVQELMLKNKELEKALPKDKSYQVSLNVNSLVIEMQNLQAQVEQLSNDEAHRKLEHIEKQNDILLKENEKLHIEVSMLRKQNLWKQKQDTNPIVFQDDIYGEIVVDHPLIMRIVKTRQFQRLKDIKKLGYTYLNIPKANYSRLQHSIGMYFLAGQYVKQLRRRQPELNITDSDILCVQIAALCFNLGHGPFSHIFEMFLDEMSKKDNSDRPWKNVSEASVKMFDYMLEDNEDLMANFEKHFDNPKEDIAFIKELIQGTGYEHHKDKKFLHKIVYNKKSGLDVSMIDSTMRDAAVLGKNLTFQWRVFFNQVRVLRCDDGELHKCFSKDDLETCNDLFRTRHALFRELYYLRKNRIASVMIRRILVKSNGIPIIKDDIRRVTISDATKSMSAYTQLNDGILSVIKHFIDDKEVQELLKCLESLEVIGQTGWVTLTNDWNEDRIKQHIVRSIKSCDVTDQLILDPIKTGYENWNALTQYYYTSDGKTGQWKQEWAQPPQFADKQLRILLVSGDRVLIKEVQKTLQKLITDEQLVPGEIYPDEENYNLMPQVPPLKKEEATELKEEVASALATV